ncbi:helix-turn-helix domain-containing protein [Prauserella sp. ASG 168]|uniref:Helix-turn-helix domain-containing protein n=2 Tax=Prauserella cavernicola TaxID=2800127 RepID=A0A934QYJ7_9PSEU|nr:helix-turn-helix domain-containing protein [Prauserella cavernicola]
MGASELARHLGLSVPTAHRLVSGMVRHGLLRRDAEGRHHVGHRFTSSALAGAAVPVLKELSRTTGETAQLWARRGADRLCLASVESPEELRASVPVGTVLPLSAKGSAALVLTVADAGSPRWLQSVSERTPGLSSVSAAVRHGDEVIAAVCLAAPVSRVSADGPGADYGHLVVAAADELEEALRAR